LRIDPSAFSSQAHVEEAFDQGRWRQRLSRAAVFVAEAEGGPIGLVAGIEAPEGDGAELVSMWVAPEWRGHGAAAPLIEAVREWAARSRFERLGLWVVEGNLVAEKAYAKAGFERTGRRQPVREGEPAMEFEMARRP